MYQSFQRKPKLPRLEKGEPTISYRKVKPANACDNCNGIGSVVVDHHAWLSGGAVKEEDVWDCCMECDGTGSKPKDTNEET
jgi:DnaJ-class molecular chaperone